jgi:hypothetical protein
MRLKPPLLLLALAASAASLGSAAELVSVRPLTDRILLVHFDEGRVEYHRRGQPRSADTVHISPLDVAAASLTRNYTLASAEDRNYRTNLSPLSVGRKSKGMEFAWFVDSWVNGRTVNNRPDQIREHWLYLELPTPLQRGQSYTLGTGDLANNGREWTFTFHEPSHHSEAIHVNALGYLPDVPQKFGYLYAWMGDKGPLDLSAWQGKPFHLIDTATGKTAFTGTIAFRKPRTQQETYQLTNTPGGNFLGADVWECDFSAFHTPGTYTLSVEGIGSSWPFRIAADVYRDPFYHVIRSLYHNRSGIELKAPHTTFVRPAPHNPKLTPGFQNRLYYTTVRFTEWGSEGGTPEILDAGRKGNLTETWGWYQDAGDWDGYPTHLRPAFELLLTYETHPTAFTDGQLDLPESGNGVPDLIDEAAWLPRYAHRLRHELLAKGWGTGGVSLRVTGDAYGSDEKILPDGNRVGQGSWEDVDRDWMVAGEDPWSTYRYAAVAAQLAHALKFAGVTDPEGVDWTKEARESFAWAADNTRPGDEGRSRGEEPLGHTRLLAAAALFRLTGEAGYENQFQKDAADIRARTVLSGERLYAAAIYALGGGPAEPDADTLRVIRSAVLASADEIVINTPSRRALRWGGHFGMPMLVGQQTTPWVIEGIVGYALARETDTAKARAYLAGIATTADYFLGTNPENRVYITGLGPRSVVHVFHMDAWYLSDPPVYQPGLIPYANWLKATDGVGPWDQGWPHHTVHPEIDLWPGAERYFPNRCSPLGSEFTIHQQSGPAAAAYGFLHAIGQSSAAPAP